MIGFAGLSHLGVVSSVATAAKGFEVVAYDEDAALCQRLADGLLPFYEPDLADLLASNGSRLRFTNDPGELARCDVVYVSLDVPTDSEHHADLEPVRRLIERIAPYIGAGSTLVVLSQVRPGFTRALARDLQDRSVHVIYQVETLILGRAVERALRPERFIVGCGDATVPLPAPYASLLGSFDCPVLPMRYESAELAKIAVNMFLASSVCVTNTLAELCEAIGADWAEIVPSLQLDSRIGPDAYLRPGLGIGGGNLERDMATVRELAQEFGSDAGVIDAWRRNSQHRLDWALRAVHAQVASKGDGHVIAIWGLAYKAGTSSVEGSPALALIGALGSRSVRAYDPEAMLAADQLPGASRAPSALEACLGADVLAVMTPWPEFSSVDLARVRDLMTGRVIIDPFGAIDARRCAELGFSHFRLGLPALVGGPVA